MVLATDEREAAPVSCDEPRASAASGARAGGEAAQGRRQSDVQTVGSRSVEGSGVSVQADGDAREKKATFRSARVYMTIHTPEPAPNRDANSGMSPHSRAQPAPALRAQDVSP